MLINFSVEFFRSFGEEQTLNMVASALKDHPGHCVSIPGTEKSVLQAGVLYGANASGKSNLIKAMLFAQQMVLGKASLKSLALNRFRFVNKDQPSSFEFRFLSHGQVFVHGFTATRDGVVEEWLDAMSESGREVNVFTRRGTKIDLGNLTSLGRSGGASKKILSALSDLGVRDDQLLLNRIVELPDKRRGELLNRVVWWLTECLTIVEAESEYMPLINLIQKDDDFRRFCEAFLKNVGTGINGLDVQEEQLDAEKIPGPLLDRMQSPDGNNFGFLITGAGLALELDADEPTKVVRKNLNALHEVNRQSYPIAFREESDGTQRCLHLLPALYHLTRENNVFVVDELDRSLHPLLCHSLLKLFLNACPGHFQQMIVTTHETHLLDLDLLRRDEVWFAEKDRRQQSRLSSLSEMKIRNDLRIEKGYLQGRFGGIPFIGDSQKLLGMIQCPPDGTRHEKETSS